MSRKIRYAIGNSDDVDQQQQDQSNPSATGLGGLMSNADWAQRGDQGYRLR